MKCINLIIILAAVILFASCTKSQQKNTACGTQVCSAIFASVGVSFTDKNNGPILITNFEAINLRTNKPLVHVISPNIDYLAGYEIVADDSNLKDLSTDGDNVKVSATNPATGEIKTATLKIAGGCNCHVSKISGPDKIPFD